MRDTVLVTYQLLNKDKGSLWMFFFPWTRKRLWMVIGAIITSYATLEISDNFGDAHLIILLQHASNFSKSALTIFWKLYHHIGHADFSFFFCFFFVMPLQAGYAYTYLPPPPPPPPSISYHPLPPASISYHPGSGPYIIRRYYWLKIQVATAVNMPHHGLMVTYFTAQWQPWCWKCTSLIEL